MFMILDEWFMKCHTMNVLYNVYVLSHISDIGHNIPTHMSFMKSYEGIYTPT